MSDVLPSSPPPSTPQTDEHMGLTDSKQARSDLGDAAESWVRDELLPCDLPEELPELPTVLEVPDEGGEVIESPEGQLEAAGVLRVDGAALVAEDDFVDHANAFLAQDLAGERDERQWRKEKQSLHAGSP